jgi:hypothetical protein
MAGQNWSKLHLVDNFVKDRLYKTVNTKEYTFSQAAGAYNMNVETYIQLVNTTSYKNHTVYVDLKALRLDPPDSTLYGNNLSISRFDHILTYG